MTDTFVAVNGVLASHVVLAAAESGPWWADCALEGAEPMAGKAVLQVGTKRLHGTIDPEFSGVFAQQFRCRIVGGANGWGETVGSKIYHNDAQTKGRTIADDAAKEVGETIVTFPADAPKVVDFVRTTGPASRALELAAGTLSWWVDFAGNTHVGPRPVTKTDTKLYALHHYNPQTGSALLGNDDLDVWIGSEISEGLEAPSVVRDIEVTITGDKMLTRAVLSTKPGAGNMLDTVIRAIVMKLTGSKLNGLYRYRVLRMGPDGRVSLQAVRKLTGLPDLLPVQQWPGVAGAHATLKKGAIVVVQFLDDGDPTQPVVTNFQGKQGPGYVPEVLTLGGEEGAAEVARKGDSVKCLYPPTVITGTMIVGGVPTPFTGVNVSTTGQILGVIQGGTPAVKAGIGR